MLVKKDVEVEKDKFFLSGMPGVAKVFTWITFEYNAAQVAKHR